MRAAFRRVRLTGLDLAAVILLFALALSGQPGEIAPDTKLDLYVDPWGFLNRALHLWDPQVSWGLLQNQGYGYLFPMGPFFGVTSSILPMWVCQRLWWILLLLTGYLGMRVLLRAMGVASERTLGPSWEARVAVLASLAYAVCPRVVSTVGTISSETLPVVLAPWILAPLVLADRGILGPRRAAALSGLATLCCGGVNAAAVVYALIPAGIWILTRPRWWRSALSWWSLLAVLLSTAWWLGPLVLLGRYSPPFLDWIENVGMVSAQVSLLDVARGTTHWLARLVSVKGAWWPAGFELATAPVLILTTTSLAALGLWGMARPGLPHRRPLLLTALLGVLVLALPHVGSLDSPFVGAVQATFDGLLSPFRNVHKADPLIRLPLTVALAHGLAGLAAWRPVRRTWRVPIAWIGVTAALVSIVGAGVGQGISAPGSFASIPRQWVDAGAWLTERRAEGAALVVPSSSFGEYSWGRPLDEPLRPLTTAAYAVRDSVPLTPAGTIRFLDEVEQRLQSGRSLRGAVAALRSSGTRFLVLRNDLDAYGAGQPPVALARSAIRDTPDVALVAGFGRSFQNEAGVRVQPVEIYDLGAAAPLVQVWAAEDVLAASGASEALPTLADAGWSGPVVFDGDSARALTPGTRVDTDTYRARERFFGSVRGRDSTSSLTLTEDTGVRDYRPWAAEALRSTTQISGVAAVTASSSLATDPGILGLWPAYAPSSALDGDPATAWVAAYQRAPTLRVTFEQGLDPGSIAISPWRDRGLLPRDVGVAERLRIRTEGGEVTVAVDPAAETPTVVQAPSGRTRWVEVQVLDTDRGPTSTTVTGLAEVDIPGVRATRSVVLADPVQSARTAAVVLSTGARPTDGCVVGDGASCLPYQLRTAEETTMARQLPLTIKGNYDVAGTVTVDPRTPPEALTRPAGVTVGVSSSSTPSARGSADALTDGDSATTWSPASSDRAPELTLTFDHPRTMSSLALEAPRPWGVGQPVYAIVTVDGRAQSVPLSGAGLLSLNPETGSVVSVRIVRPQSGAAPSPPLRISGVRIDGELLTPARDVLDLGCGVGPTLRVDGHDVPTSLRLTKDDLDGRDVPWQACAPVSLSGGTQGTAQTVELSGPAGVLPSSLVLRSPDDSPRAHDPFDGRARWVTPSTVEATVSASTGPRASGPRVLDTMINANPGWQASVGEVALEPIVLDGFRQGFVLPEGTHGVVRITFGPDGKYRFLLLVGAVFALLLVAGTVLPEGHSRRRAVAPPAAEPVRSRAAFAPGAHLWGPVLAGVCIGALLMGVVGAGVALVAGAASLLWSGGVRPSRRAGARAAGPVLLLGAGLLQAVVAPAAVGFGWVEATVRVLVLSAFVTTIVSGARSSIDGAPPTG